MARPKKDKPDARGLYRTQRTIGHEPNGKPIIKSFSSKKSKKHADAKADEFMAKTDYTDITFEAWADKWLWDYKEPFVRENTFEYTYRQPLNSHLLPYFRHFKLSDISNSMIQVFFNNKRSCSISALSKMRLCLNQMFECAIANGIIKYNPCTTVKISSTQEKKQSTIYTAQEVEDIINLCYIHRFGLYIHILVRMGLRVSELCGLKWEDINLEKGTMSIERGCTDYKGSARIGPPKSAKSIRTIPIPQDLLKELKSERGKGYVIISPTGNNVSPHVFTEKRYNVFFRETGYKKLTPKQMRHTVGTLLYEKCHDIYAVKSFLGHSNVNITSNTYVHANPQDLAKQLFD